MAERDDEPTLEGYLQVWMRGSPAPIPFFVRGTESLLHAMLAGLAKDINESDDEPAREHAAKYAVGHIPGMRYPRPLDQLRPGLWVRAGEVVAVTFSPER